MVIDHDPQGNATTGLGLSNTEQSDKTIYGILNGTTSISDVVKKTNLNDQGEPTNQFFVKTFGAFFDDLFFDGKVKCLAEK